MQRLIHDFPEARTVSLGTLRALRDIDPAAEVLYLGPSPKGGRWMVGTVTPDVRLQAMAGKTLASLQRIPGYKRGIAWYRRHRMAHAQRQGFRPTAIYECDEPGGQVVFDITRADFLHRHRSDNEFWQAMDDEQYDDQRAREAQLTDRARANEAWRYAFTRSHAPGISLTPTVQRPSYVTTHPTPTTAA